MNGIPRLTFMMGLALVLALNACGRSLAPSAPADADATRVAPYDLLPEVRTPTSTRSSHGC